MVIVVGKVGKNPVIDKMVSNKILDVSNSTGKWETFDTQVVEKQFVGVARELIIDGSDKRGTIFGIYDLCTHVGVSPWNWWAYVPPIKSKNLFVKARRSVQGEPIVKDRGIFFE